MKPYSLKLILLSCSLIAFFSCKKSDSGSVSSSSTVTSLKEYQTFVSEDYTGKALLYSSAGMYTSPGGSTVQLSTTMKGNQALSLVINNQSVATTRTTYSESGGKVSYTSDDSGLKAAFGQNLSINVSNASTMRLMSTDTNTSSTTTSATVYIPKEIRATISTMDADGEGRGGILEDGAIITWNADSENKKGVILYFTTNPGSETEKIYVAGYTVEDIGTYTFKSSDLAAFPDDKSVTLDVIRVGYGRAVNDSGADYAVAGMTNCSIGATFKKSK